MNTEHQAERWTTHYAGREALRPVYPTEWVVRVLAGGRYPRLHLDRSTYPGQRVLDMGCGDGRHLGLLQDLGFEVHAVELTESMVQRLRAEAVPRGWTARFAVGSNVALPYPDAHFDVVLCSASAYYLPDGVDWPAVRAELARVLRPAGVLVADVPDSHNAVLEGATPHADGSFTIRADPFGLRNGTRFMAAETEDAAARLWRPELEPLALGHRRDDFFGIRVSGWMTVARRVG